MHLKEAKNKKGSINKSDSEQVCLKVSANITK